MRFFYYNKITVRLKQELYTPNFIFFLKSIFPKDVKFINIGF